MARYPLLTFIVLLEILHIVYCGNDSFNPFTPELSQNTELGGTLQDKIFLFQTNEAPSQEKTVEKRRLILNGMNSPSFDSENAEFSTRKRTNYSETEIENQTSEFQQGYNSWKDGQNSFSLPSGNAHSSYLPEFRVGQPSAGQINQNFNWEHNNDVSEKTQSRWNEHKISKPFSNPQFNPRLDTSYRPLQKLSEYDENFNIHPGRNGDFFNRRMPVTTLNNLESASIQNFNNGVDDINSEYLGHSNINYYNRNSKASWNPNYYRPEKGVIINFNTECPAPKQFNNQLVHKFMLTPKSSLTTQSQISTFPIPQTAIISAHKMTPMYYL